MREVMVRAEAAEKEVKRLQAEIENSRQQNKAIISTKETRLKQLEDENKTLTAKAKDSEKIVQSLKQQLQQQQLPPPLTDGRLKRLEDEKSALTSELNAAEASILLLKQQLQEQVSQQTLATQSPKPTAAQGAQTIVPSGNTISPPDAQALRSPIPRALADLPRTLADVGMGPAPSLCDLFGALPDKPRRGNAIDIRISLPRRLCEIDPLFSTYDLLDVPELQVSLSLRQTPAK